MDNAVVKILVVDDDAEDRSLLLDTFSDLGRNDCLHFEENGEKAIEYLQGCTSRGTLPCLVVLDLNMPKLNGRQTLEFIKKQPLLKEMTVVIYSTSLNPKERSECLALGAWDYVVKPISYKESLEVANQFYDLCFAPGEKDGE
jgi:two-component system response regulator